MPAPASSTARSLRRMTPRMRAVLALLPAVTALFAGSRMVSAAPSASPYPGGQWPEAAGYGVGVDSVVMVPMDDGVQIRLQVFYPTDPTTGVPAAGPGGRGFPVLLTQTPYSANLGVAGNVPACKDLGVPGE